MRTLKSLAALATLGTGVLVCAAAVDSDTRQDDRGRPAAVATEGYVGAQTCRACHLSNHASWKGSYHRTMTQVASSASIRAPFVGSTPTYKGWRWELEADGDAHFVTPVHVATGDRSARTEIALVTGSHHYQIYWLAAEASATPGERSEGMGQLPLVWHLGERRWVPRVSMFLFPPTPDVFEETGRWRATCIKCHATNGTSEVDGGATEVVEFGISCEACHGPGARHVELHERERDDPSGSASDRDELITHPELLPHTRSSEICGQCHSIQPLATNEARERWRREGFAYRPGDELARTRTLVRGVYEANSAELRAYIDRHPNFLIDRFWPDGEVRVSGREYNGLVDSPCFQRGELGCLSCHSMHADDAPDWAADQLAPDRFGAAACIACHTSFADAERVAAHTHHAQASSGSDCLNCHMPRTTYGLTKAIRSHTISSPSARTSLESGRPNACNLCHLDRSLGWTANRLAEWYDAERPALDPVREEVSAVLLDALAGDAGLRALAADSMGWKPARDVSGTGWMLPYLGTLAMDPYDAVRWIAVRSLREHAGYGSFALEFTDELEAQRNVVRERVVAAWRASGLTSTPAQRAALLIRPDGTLDEERFRAIYAGRDRRAVGLAE